MSSEDDVRERREARREEERRRAASRRWVAIGGLVLAALAVAAVVALAGGGGSNDAAREGSPGGGGKAGTQEAKGGGEASGASVSDAPTVSDFRDPVPILMYHGISPPPAGNPSPDLFVPQATFEEQVKSLADAGYNAVTLDDVFAAWNDGEPIAENPIVVSFDDGLRSQYVGARPMMQALGWPGVLNLKVDSVDQGELDEGAVNDLIDDGWEVNSHTISHADLTTLDGAALTEEVAGSRKELQQRFGVPVNFFCYPAGAYDDEAIAAVEAAGYEGATTVDPGLASPDEPFTMKRIRVNPDDSGQDIKQAIENAT